MRIMNLVESQPRRRGWWVWVWNSAGVGQSVKQTRGKRRAVYALWGSGASVRVRGDRRARCMSRWQCIR